MTIRTRFAAAAAALLAGCQTAQQPPIAIVPRVNLERFMGDWYVIANIPTLIEKGAHNAIESYKLDDDGTIATTFTFRAGAFDGEPKRYTPRGFVLDRESNAVWGMRFLWPIKADYRIVYLADDYSQTVIGREKRDYVWIMARTPSIPEADYQRILQTLAAQGYDVARIQTVPQRWN
jgi:apolipoprotein D and lipocalin family protein